MPANHVDTVIVGGQIVTSSQVYESSIAISGEKIVAIGPEGYLPPADNYIDASGKFVLPGLIDSHVHLDGHDDYALGSLAAAHAGLTTLIPFGTYQLEGDETLPQATHRTRETVEQCALTDFAFQFSRAASAGRRANRQNAERAHRIALCQYAWHRISSCRTGPASWPAYPTPSTSASSRSRCS